MDQQINLMKENHQTSPLSSPAQPNQDSLPSTVNQQLPLHSTPNNDAILDVIHQLSENQNPLPLIAIVDKVDLCIKTKEGVPIFNLLMNKFLPLSEILDNLSIKFQSDQDGRTPLHYAVQVDDVRAVQWLLSKNAKNIPDNFGNTPVMDAVRLGHKRSFLLCLHYQHLNQQLPHIAAQYNRVWQLKCMLAYGLSLQKKNSLQLTPLQIGVQNYSYEAAEYLSQATGNYSIVKLKNLSDSEAIIRKIKKGKQNKQTLSRCILPLIYKILQIIILLIVINHYEQFQTVRNTFNKGILSVVSIEFVMFLLSHFKKPEKKTREDIMRLLHEPYFPNNLDHICPSCFRRYHPEKEDHCDICHICIPKFHKHTYMCINKSNEFLWYASSFIYLYILYLGLMTAINFTVETFPIEPESNSLFYKFCYTIYHIYSIEEDNILGVLMILLTGFFFHQIFHCIQLFSMAFMSRTYQQTVKTENYPHLYSVFKSKAGKMKTKEKRIFEEYKICGGICVGIKNILTYFF